jgi:hypothetical protein
LFDSVGSITWVTYFSFFFKIHLWYLNIISCRKRKILLCSEARAPGQVIYYIRILATISSAFIYIYKIYLHWNVSFQVLCKSDYQVYYQKQNTLINFWNLKRWPKKFFKKGVELLWIFYNLVIFYIIFIFLEITVHIS